VTVEISAQELVSDGLPRPLQCRGLTLSEISRRYGMKLQGQDGEIARFATLSALAKYGGPAITYLTSAGWAEQLPAGAGVAVITRADLVSHLKEGNSALIVEDDPHDAFYTAFAAAVRGGNFETLQSFRSPQAKVHPMASIAENVHIEAGAVIGAGAVVLSNAYIGRDVVIKPNATVSGDGYENAVIDGRRALVPHAGGVWLSEGVHVGSSCIDKGLFGDFTFAGAYTTMDNLVHFGHSVRAGKNCSLTACAELSGGVVLGDGVWLGPNCSVIQGVTIGDHCFVGIGAVVTRDLPPHSQAAGSPARVLAKVCVCRTKLQFENDLATCEACGKRYRLDAEGQVQRA
jgi:UDP-3-O-[3-hydroxymyristoyl] glucosamine N-acyltransferase